MADPYLELPAGALLTAGDWNRMQERLSADIAPAWRTLAAMEDAVVAKERAVAAVPTEASVRGVSTVGSLLMADWSWTQHSSNDTTVLEPTRGLIISQMALHTPRGLSLALPNELEGQNELQSRAYFPLRLTQSPTFTFDRPTLVQIRLRGVAVVTYLTLNIAMCTRGTGGIVPISLSRVGSEGSGTTRPSQGEFLQKAQNLQWTSTEASAISSKFSSRPLVVWPQKIMAPEIQCAGGTTAESSRFPINAVRWAVLPEGSYSFIPCFNTAGQYYYWPRFEHYPYLLELNQRVLALPLDP